MFLSCQILASAFRALKLDFRKSRTFLIPIHSRLSLSRTRLSRITVYLEVKMVPVLTKRSTNRQQNIVEKRSNFSSFPQYFQYISNLGVKLHIHSVKNGCSINWFPHFHKSDKSKYGHPKLKAVRPSVNIHPAYIADGILNMLPYYLQYVLFVCWCFLRNKGLITFIHSKYCFWRNSKYTYINRNK